MTARSSLLTAWAALVATVAAATLPAPASLARAGMANLEDELFDRGESVEAALELYLKARGRGGEWEPAYHRSQIMRAVFAQAGTPGYERSLRAIDEAAGRDPLAVHELSLYLQRHWETRYGAAVSCLSTTGLTAGSQLGALAGLSALGAAMFFKPQSAPRYFRLFRNLLPLAGFYGGKAVGATLPDGRQVPAAPAQIMHLGLPDDFRSLSEDKLIEQTRDELLSIAVGLSSYALINARLAQAVRVAKVMNRATTPLKITPAGLVALVGSSLIVYAVEKGAEEYGRHQGRSTRLAALRSARFRIDEALVQRDPQRAYEAASGFASAAVGLARFLNAPVFERVQEYARRIHVVEKRYGESAAGQRELAALAEDFNTDIDKLRRELDREAGARYGEFVASQLPEPSARQQARLAAQLRQGTVPLHPDHVLLQGAAYLRELNQPSLEGHADLLLSVLQSQRALQCQVGAGAADRTLLGGGDRE
jgi:hypothetical protein